MTKKNRLLLTNEFTCGVGDDDLKYINVTARRRKGKIVLLILEDDDCRLGNMYVTIDKETADNRDTTLEGVFADLVYGGAYVVNRRKSPPKMHPVYD